MRRRIEWMERLAVQRPSERASPMPWRIAALESARGLILRGARGWRGGWPRLRVSLPRVARQVLGAPDYAAYLEHCRRAGHSPCLTERQFLDQFFAVKGKRVRCC